MKILLTGASGFVGGKLLSRLIEDGHNVRCLVRSQSSAKKLDGKNVEIVIGDALEFDSISQALHGCESAFYLIHSMDGDGDYEEKDRRCATTFAKAAQQTGLNRIIYLSGLANEDSGKLSNHLASRLEVGRILRSGEVPCIEFRAAMIIGKESTSFKMVEHLCKRLPVMLCPKWLSTETQPISIVDLLKYLTASLQQSEPGSIAIEIGGKDRATYLQILKEYCRIKGLRRLMIPVPFLSTYLSGLWLSLVTPETAHVGKAMIDGLRNPTFVRSQLARELFPDIEPMTISDAMQLAISGAEKTKSEAN